MQEEDKAEKSKTKEKPKKKKTAGRYALEFFIKIIVTVLAAYIICNYVIGIYIMHGNTEYPMIKDGDLCIIYRHADLHNGDEIIYTHSGELHFGRIVAAEGDEVNIYEESMTINGYGVFEDAVYPTTGEGALIDFPYIVPSGSVFVLNDYRSDPTDSRSYGAISFNDIKGKIIFVMRRRGI